MRKVWRGPEAVIVAWGDWPESSYSKGGHVTPILLLPLPPLFKGGKRQTSYTKDA